MSNGFSLSDLLQDELFKRKHVNSSYSLRAFARQLGLSSSYVSKLITGKRSISEETLLRIASRLNLPEHKIDELTSQVSRKIPTTEFESLRSDQFRMIADWHHYAILECATLVNFEGSAEWIARRLSISEDRAQAALDRLLRLDLLKINKAGKLVPVNKDYSGVNPSGPTTANTEHEKQILEGAINALTEISTEHRMQGSITIAIPSSRVTEAKDKLRKFRREFMTTLQRRGSRDAVYQLSISFYPVTKIEGAL